jgi:multiple sugar transport system permease protein
VSTTIADTPITQRERSWLTKFLRYRTAGQTRECLWGYLFAAPWLLGLLIFVLGPIIVSLFLSFTKYNVINPPQWLGLTNYIRAFFEDELFWPSMGRTFHYALMVVPFGIGGALALALLLNQGHRATNLFRTLYFLPNLTPSVAMALLWLWLLHPTVGPVNFVLSLVGITGPGWLTNPRYALNSIILINLWAYLGGTNMLIFLAGLQGVPQELYDAADVDGAGRGRKFLHVTLPMISPTLFFNLIMGVIGALKVFTIAYVATNGGPSWSTWFYGLHLYTWSFVYFEMGYGAALAWIFAMILIILTMLQFRASKAWVFYAGGEA